MEKFIAINSYMERKGGRERRRKGERSQINNLTLQLQVPEKGQTKPKASRRIEIIKIRGEIGKTENKKL